MGAKSDRMSVVDSTGKVHGTLNLRVADASIMPRVPSGNTHLPTVMVAEKISAVMKLGQRSSGPPVTDGTPADKRFFPGSLIALHMPENAAGYYRLDRRSLISPSFSCKV